MLLMGECAVDEGLQPRWLELGNDQHVAIYLILFHTHFNAFIDDYKLIRDGSCFIVTESIPLYASCPWSSLQFNNLITPINMPNVSRY